MRSIKRSGESELKQKLATTASWDNGIKMDVVVVDSILLGEFENKLKQR